MHRLVVGIVVIALCSCGQTRHAHVDPHAGHALGKVDFPVSCSAAARTQFNHAMALLHHMTYPQAQLEFEQVAATDPHCALAHWGIAMTLFQPLWPTRPNAAALQRGWDEVGKAVALQAPTQRERLFIATADAFFREPSSTDYWLRIRRWEAATRQLHAAFPDDPEATVFHALALLATAPSDRISRDNADEAAALLMRVYERNPDHPGAMHYLVHANDVPGRERESLDITHRYEAAAPRNPHALHMPTHIYTRLGDWPAVIHGNLQAADAALEQPAGDQGQYVWDEFAHAIEYMVYAYLQQGADEQALAQIQRLRTTANIEPTFKTAFHIASTQARYALERRQWNEAVQLMPREPATLDWNRFPWPEAITQFARGLGAVHLGRSAEASAAGERLTLLEASARKSGEELFARNIAVLHLGLDGWIAQSAGRSAAAVALLQQAAELEAATPKHAVTPGPTLPAFEQLGDLLREQRQPAAALAAYKRSMDYYPRRLNSLLGAARAARAADNVAEARDFYRAVLEVAGESKREAVMQEARSFIKP
jgi:tetratricopeptide (TPR) repeat protein